MGSGKKHLKMGGPGSTVVMKVHSYFGQPKLFHGTDGGSVPPMPSFARDTYMGTDSGFLPYFTMAHAILYNPMLAQAWGAVGWDGSTYIDEGCSINANFAYNDQDNIVMPARGMMSDSWKDFFGLQQPVIADHMDSVLQWKRPLGSGLLRHRGLLTQSGGGGYFKIPYAFYWMMGTLTNIRETAGDWSPAQNGVCGNSYPDSIADLMDYSKSLTKFIIVEPAGAAGAFSVLNGYQECVSFNNSTNLCDQWAWVQNDKPKRFCCVRPKCLFSNEEGYGEDGACHVYPKKVEGGEEVDDDDYLPIDPAYHLGDKIHCNCLAKKICVSTNPYIVMAAYDMGCSDDIIVIITPNGEVAVSLWASLEDSNVEARKRSAGGEGVKGYDPECITICDDDGNEKQGYMLFKEEECRDDIMGTEQGGAGSGSIPGGVSQATTSTTTSPTTPSYGTVTGVTGRMALKFSTTVTCSCDTTNYNGAPHYYCYHSDGKTFGYSGEVSMSGNSPNAAGWDNLSECQHNCACGSTSNVNY